MKGKKTTRRALVMSLLSLLLCCSMLVGTTFAWFTDSVTSGRNKIVAGNLDVTLDYYDATSKTFKEVTSDVKLFDDNALWEPGHTEVAYLKVANAGSLALKYQLAVNVYAEETGTNVFDKEFKLSDYLVFKVIEIEEDKVGTFTRETARTEAGSEWGLKAYESEVKPLEPKKDGVETNNDDYVMLVIYMPETVDNNANYKTGTAAPFIQMGVVLNATQYTYEEDSFDNKYDANAYLTTVFTPAELQGALNDGKGAKLGADITLPTGTSLEIPAGTNSVLDLNGNKLIADDYAIENANGSTLTIMDSGKGGASTGTLNDVVALQGGSITGIVYNEKGTMIINGGTFNPADGGKYTVLNASGKLTINGGIINGGSSYPVYSYDDGHELIINDVTVNGVFGCINAYAAGTVKVNGGTFTMTGVEGKTSHMVYISGTTAATINGGTFKKIGDINMSATGGGGICSNSSSTITINGGNFAGAYRDLYVWSKNSSITVKGGSFKFSPTSEGAKIADGYEAKQNADGSYAVGVKDINTLITSDATVTLPAGEYTLPTLSGKEGVTIEGVPGTVIGGENATTGFDGNFGKGNTYKNLTFTGSTNGARWTYGNGGIITFENCQFLGESTYGFHMDQSNGATLIFKNCTFSGFNAFAGDLVKVQFENCTFLHNGNYGHTNIWSVAEYIDCVWGDKTSVSCADGGKLIFDGVEENYHHEFIGTAESLIAFEKSVNEGNDSWNGQKVILVDDINLYGKTWTPIGQTGATQFKGIFDGNGHTIKNLTIDSSANTGANYSSGLFGWLNHATVKNVTVDGATVTGNHNVAVIAGYLETSGCTVSNCHVTNATVVAKHANDDACGDKAGVIVGHAGNTGVKVDGCTATNSTVTAGRDAGQIVGAALTANVTGCTATNVAVTATGDCTGANVNNAVIGRVLG